MARSSLNKEQIETLYKWAFILALITVGYNVVEGLISVFFGIKDEALTLFGFGVDSFIETISALGITQMIIRIRRNPESRRGDFEITALKITGWCFYILAILLFISALYNLLVGHQPLSTLAGTIIASISIISMWILIRAKISIGKKLESAPIIADARCNLVCLYMSLILLMSSLLWWLWQIPHVDTLGALGLIYFSVKEGKEAFEKAKGIECSDCECDD